MNSNADGMRIECERALRYWRDNHKNSTEWFSPGVLSTPDTVDNFLLIGNWDWVLGVDQLPRQLSSYWKLGLGPQGGPTPV